MIVVLLADAGLNLYIESRIEAPGVALAPGRYVGLDDYCAGRLATAREALGVDPQAPSAAPERIAVAARASAALLATNFFYNGRGIHSSPSSVGALEFFRRDRGWKGTLFRRWIARNTGLAFDATGGTVGGSLAHYQGVPVHVHGCALCHAGKVLGRTTPGLGNKNIDPYALAILGVAFQELPPHWLNGRADSPAAERLESQASTLYRKNASHDHANLTQGMVPVLAIHSWFYEIAGRESPPDSPRGAVKPPALWGFGEKRKAGLFCDGFADGVEAGWPAGVELASGQRPEGVRAYLPKLAALEQSFAELLPPAYPLPIDWALAEHGKQVFAGSCLRCHGAYRKDAGGLPIFEPPKRIAIAVVDTDRDRLALNTPEFFSLVKSSPLADVIRLEPRYRPGYFAPRLEGVSARFPYLHNGSVPNIAALLTRPGERPRIFDLRDAGETDRFDPDTLGLTMPEPHSVPADNLARLADQGARYVYDVRRVGHSNRGHNFGTALGADEKRALVEYLKTL